MKIHALHAVGFRNIENERVEFSDGVNLLYGNNAEGKTNLLEAVYYFARGRSFRGAHDRELCGFGGRSYEIEAEFTGGGRRQSLLYRYGGREKVRKRNGAPVDTAAEMIGHFRAVIFHPEHLSLVKGSPQERRDFLNVAISQIDPAYIRDYAIYQRTLEERNSLLKMAQKGLPVTSDEIAVWGQRLSEAAARVAKKRYDYLHRLAPYAEAMLSDMTAGKEKLKLSYKCELPDESVPILSEKYAILFTSDVARDIAAGFTVHGPHHDDIEIELGGHPAREFASQGQQRSITLSMKLAEGEVSREVSGEYPVFLFDDVMSELDAERRQYLLRSLSGRQIIVTACDGRDFSPEGARLIRTKGGKYEAVSQ
jgi:DNA replication and repair protein RecF